MPKKIIADEFQFAIDTTEEDRKQRHRDRQRENISQRRVGRLAKGLCPRCGSEREDKKYQLCNKCREEKRKSDANNMQLGLCRNCGGKRENLVVQHCDRCREAQKTTKLKRTYDITIEDYNRMFEEQNGVCWICGNVETTNGGTLHIDHNKESGKIRGLLCGKCNRAIGCLNHSPELLQRAIEYLETFKES